MSEVHRNYLRDIGLEIATLGRSAKEAARQSGDPYDKGRLFSYYEILHRMLQEAKGFDLNASDLGLETVRLEEFLAEPKE